MPLGTGNLLAANLGVPAGLEAASEAGRHPVRSIDVGRVNGEAFTVMAGSGFDAAMIGDADDEDKARFGTLAYVRSGLANLRQPLQHTTVWSTTSRGSPAAPRWSWSGTTAASSAAWSCSPTPRPTTASSTWR